MRWMNFKEIKMENNKRIGRRAIGGLITIILVTVAYYITMLSETTIDWFKIYTGVVLIIYGLAVGGLTWTDLISRK